MHVEKMSINSNNRRHDPSIKPGSQHDLFYKLGPDSFRLWQKGIDPAPRYKDDIEAELAGNVKREEASPLVEIDAPLSQSEEADARREFAFERDLRNFLEKNIHLIEAGLRIYEVEGLRGIEFPAGGRYIDILAIDKAGHLVVIELKVSRGYDRVIGQLLRYMGWVRANMDTSLPVRGIIVANNITDDLRMAASHIPNVSLIEYEMEFRLRPVSVI